MTLWNFGHSLSTAALPFLSIMCLVNIPARNPTTAATTQSTVNDATTGTAAHGLVLMMDSITTESRSVVEAGVDIVVGVDVLAVLAVLDIVVIVCIVVGGVILGVDVLRVELGNCTT